MIPNPITIGAGIGIGSIQIAIFKSQVTPLTWKWCAFGNIIAGGIALGLVTVTNIVRNESIKLFLTCYGWTAIIGGIIYGLTESPAMRQGMSLSQQAAAYNGYISPTYYPDVKGTFVMRPESKAKGWASDVTRNPMAAIPTTLPATKLVF